MCVLTLYKTINITCLPLQTEKKVQIYSLMSVPYMQNDITMSLLLRDILGMQNVCCAYLCCICMHYREDLKKKLCHILE